MPRSSRYCCGTTKSGDEVVRRAAVASDRHVVQHREPEQRLHVDVVRLGRERIPEEENYVDAGFRDQRAELRVTAEGSGEQQVDPGIEVSAQALARGARRVERTSLERPPVEGGPFDHLLLAPVV